MVLAVSERAELACVWQQALELKGLMRQPLAHGWPASTVMAKGCSCSGRGTHGGLTPSVPAACALQAGHSKGRGSDIEEEGSMKVSWAGGGGGGLVRTGKHFARCSVGARGAVCF